MNVLSKFVCVAALATAVFSAPANAQSPGKGPGMMGQGMGSGMPGQGMGMVKQSCKAEIEKHCAAIPHGALGVPICLEKHASELSDACKSALENRGPAGPGRGRMRNQ